MEARARSVRAGKNFGTVPLVLSNIKLSIRKTNILKARARQRARGKKFWDCTIAVFKLVLQSLS